MSGAALAVVTITATVLAVWWVPRSAVRPRPGKGWRRHPGTWLLIVVGLLFVNQLFFTAFVVQAWHGDVGAIARYMPAGWFDLADLGEVAYWLPAWEGAVMRVQAGLELPFVMLAYLLVCRWFGTSVFRRVMAARWWISVSWTVVFCLIEWDLRNPYTITDIVIRLVAGVLTPAVLSRLSEGDAEPPGLVAFVASTGALGVVVLAVYDTATLYNLAHLVSWLPKVAAALVVLVAARWWARRRPARHGPALSAATRSLGWFLVLFAIPALPLRYGLNFDAVPASLLAGVVVIVGALVRGWERRLIGTLAFAAAVGLAGAAAAFTVAQGYPEARLLASAVAFVLAGATCCAVLDAIRRSRNGDPRTTG